MHPGIDDWLIIANPVSGGGKGSRTIIRLEQVLSNLDVNYQLRYTIASGHAMELARLAASEGWNKIAIAGGDGTCNEVINGILSQNGYNPVATEFAVISSGRGNDWIKTHGIHTDIAKAAALLRFGRSISHDAGLIDYFDEGKIQKRAFVNMSGMAIVADTLERAGRFRYQNKLVYLNALLRVITRFNAPNIRYTINDGSGVKNTGETKILALIAGNCRYAGSGMLLAPYADPSDGLLDITLIDNMLTGRIVMQLPRLFWGGLEKHPSVHLYQGTSFRFESDTPVRLEADGELLGTTPCTYSTIPAAFRLRVP
jgi:diacylglycerol kinase (ATP)